MGVILAAVAVFLMMEGKNGIHPCVEFSAHVVYPEVVSIDLEPSSMARLMAKS